jgi:hypothetical protein
MAGQPIVVSIFYDKACAKAQTTYQTLFQRILDRFTNETRSSCSACLIRLILHTTTVVNQIISNLWRRLDQPTSAIRPRVLGKPQKASDSPTADCNIWAYVQKFLTCRKASTVTAADMRIVRSCSTRQAILAAMREFSPNPNTARPIEQLQQASRSAIAVFVASSEDPHIICRFV